MNWQTLIPAGYLVLFFLSIGLIVWAVRRQWKRRAPFKSETKVLRQPGETLRRRVAEMDEMFFPQVFMAAFTPFVVVGIWLQAIRFMSEGVWPWVWLAGGIVLFAVTFLVAARWCMKKIFRRANHQIGWFGERVVGDVLAPLERQGWRIFHDVPRSERGQAFNIDHVAIGPGGIFVIETKARRKQADNEAGHVVVFDGTALKWPWGTDRSGIDQAIDNAKWLEQWLGKSTGEKLRAEPILTFPDWYVKGQTEGALRVVASSWIPEILTRRTDVLSEKQIDLFARQLDVLCRDVSD